MINVINAIIVEYGKPDEIRIEMARELKSSAAKREERTKSINQNAAENKRITEILQTEFGLSYISRNDIVKYKLYQELEANGFKTLYSNTYIPKENFFLRILILNILFQKHVCLMILSEIKLLKHEM